MRSRQVSRVFQWYIFSVGASFWMAAAPVPSIAAEVKLAAEIEIQLSQDPSLFYFYKGEKIPLQVRSNQVAVQFKPIENSTRDPNAKPLYQQLQNDLNVAVVRGGEPIAVTPVGLDYAMVKLPGTSRGDVAAQLKKQAYVKEALPVLTRENEQDTIVLPNEILVSFQPNVSEIEKRSVLRSQNLEIIRPLRFTQNRYLVRSRSATGTEILKVTQRLSQNQNVSSASPNFIQVMPDRSPSKMPETPDLPMSGRSLEKSSDRAASDGLKGDLFPLQWHLDSRSRRPNQPRTDVRAPEAWKNSTGGKGVIVAVLDSLIQWDHPNLKDNLYKSAKSDPQFPGEEFGWDFVQNDADTRISQQELEYLRPDFQFSFQPDSVLREKLRSSIDNLKQQNSKASEEEILTYLRSEFRKISVSSFHGTTVAGVIAARSADGKGVVGIAQNALILPVRVGMLGRAIQDDKVEEAIRYAAARGADVINMSFGGMTPTVGIDDVLSDVLQSNPNLIVVVAAGNDSLNQAGFPALVKGTLSVGATNLQGNRAGYSHYGIGIEVVAPGGDVSKDLQGGVLTTTGIDRAGFWNGMSPPGESWGSVQDALGNYTWTQGTSFSAPAVAGVVALMKGEDPQRKLSRDRIIAILKATASHQNLTVSANDQKLYTFLKSKSKVPVPSNPKVYFFGSGLVNAEAAVLEVKRSLK